MVIIIGLGKTGLSCVDYFLGRGVTPLVMDTRANPPGKELLPPEVELVHGLDGERLLQAHMIVASPGIALATPELKAAAERGVQIVGDIELFVRETQVPVIAITGSSSLGFARCIAFLKAIEPAILKAISLESTSWNEPSTSVTRMSTTG